MQRAESCVQLPVPLVSICSHPARERGCKEHGPGSVGFVFGFFSYPGGLQIQFFPVEDSKANCDSDFCIPTVLTAAVLAAWVRCPLSYCNVRTCQTITMSCVSCVHFGTKCHQGSPAQHSCSGQGMENPEWSPNWYVVRALALVRFVSPQVPCWLGSWSLCQQRSFYMTFQVFLRCSLSKYFMIHLAWETRELIIQP